MLTEEFLFTVGPSDYDSIRSRIVRGNYAARAVLHSWGAYLANVMPGDLAEGWGQEFAGHVAGPTKATLLLLNPDTGVCSVTPLVSLTGNDSQGWEGFGCRSVATALSNYFLGCEEVKSNLELKVEEPRLIDTPIFAPGQNLSPMVNYAELNFTSESEIARACRKEKEEESMSTIFSGFVPEVKTTTTTEDKTGTGEIPPVIPPAGGTKEKTRKKTGLDKPIHAVAFPATQETIEDLDKMTKKELVQYLTNNEVALEFATKIAAKPLRNKIIKHFGLSRK